MLKRNLFAIVITMLGLVFTSNAFGQISATTTGIKSPRDVATGQVKSPKDIASGVVASPKDTSTGVSSKSTNSNRTKGKFVPTQPKVKVNKPKTSEYELKDVLVSGFKNDGNEQKQGQRRQ